MPDDIPSPRAEAAGTTDDVTEAAIERGRAAAESGAGVGPADDAVAMRERDLASIRPGWPVFGSDGALLGPAGAVGPGFLTVAGASRMDRDMYIPRDFIESVVNGRIVLNRPRSLLLDMKLDETPVPLAAVEHPHETDATPPPAPQAAQTDVRADRPPEGGQALPGARLSVEDDPVPNSVPTTTGGDVGAPGAVAWARQTEAGAVNPAATASGLQQPYVIDSAGRDTIDGPTHQPSVTPQYGPVRGQPTEYAPFRSPQEHNETDTDLHVNREPAPPASTYWPPGSEPWSPEGPGEEHRQRG